MVIEIQGYTSDDNRNSEEYRTALVHMINALELDIKRYQEVYNEASSPKSALLLFGGFISMLLSFAQVSSDKSVNSLLGTFGLGAIVFGFVWLKDQKQKLKAAEHMLSSKREELLKAEEYYRYALRHKDKDGEFIYKDSEGRFAEKIYS